MSLSLLLFCFVVAIVLIIAMIAKFKIHPFLTLMSVSLLLGLATPIPIEKIPGIIGASFSGIFAGIGIVIIFGALIGAILEHTGAALKIADMVVRALRERHPDLAMLIMGWIVGIPVFCDSGFVVLNPIRKAIAARLATSPTALAVALSGGLYASHVFIPPTPGPVAAAGALGLGSNLLLVMALGAVVSVPVLAGVYLYARFVAKDSTLAPANDEVFAEFDSKIKQFILPSGALSLAPIFLPVLLMALGSLAPMLGLDGEVARLFKFIGSPIIALGVGLLAAIFLLAFQGELSKLSEITEQSLKSVGPILFITAAGGVLGGMIKSAGFVDILKANAASLSGIGIVFAFIISAVLKTAQGSSTVAIVTTASILGLYTADDSMLALLGLGSEYGAALAVMAIGAGAMCVSHANDSYFWVVTSLSGLSTQQGYRTQTMMTLIMGLVGVASVYLLSLVLL